MRICIYKWPHIHNSWILNVGMSPKQEQPCSLFSCPIFQPISPAVSNKKVINLTLGEVDDGTARTVPTEGLSQVGCDIEKIAEFPLFQLFSSMAEVVRLKIPKDYRIWVKK